MSLLGTLKNFFLPDPAVAAQRRLDVFGSTSKLKAGSIIVAGAVAAIAAAPAAIGGAATAAVRSTIAKVATSALPVAKAATQTVTSTVGKSFVSSPIATTLGLTVGLPIVAGIVKSNPSVITELPKQAFNSGEAIGTFVEKNPKTAIAIGGAGLVGGLIAAAEIASSKTKVENILPTNNAQLPTTTGSSPIAPTQPLTPATQVIGTPVSTSRVSRRKMKAKSQTQQRITVNVINANQSKLSTNRNYLNTRGLKALQ